jgi:hypothetical protein
MVRYPGFWTMEHGASIIRSLVEGRIIHKWLISKADESYFSKFKDYGRGHLKLQVLHMREYRDSIEAATPELDEQIAYMEALLNRDRWEEFQDISIEGTSRAQTCERWPRPPTCSPSIGSCLPP